MKIRKWDTVQVVSGKEKDRWNRAEVLKVFKDKNKVLLKDINIATKHIKKTAGQPWQIIKVEKPIDVSNVMLVCPFTDKPTRVWFTIINDKNTTKKFRFSKRALKEKWGKPDAYIIK